MELTSKDITYLRKTEHFYFKTDKGEQLVIRKWTDVESDYQDDGFEPDTKKDEKIYDSLSAKEQFSLLSALSK